jgi:hypothetical protein
MFTIASTSKQAATRGHSTDSKQTARHVTTVRREPGKQAREHDRRQPYDRRGEGRPQKSTRPRIADQPTARACEDLRGEHVVSDRIAHWTAVFEADPAVAVAARAELRSTGRLADHPYKQLGLSAALTPVEYRCPHFGDARYCPSCVGDQVEREREERSAAASARSDRAGIEDQAETIRKQSKGLAAQGAEIERLRRVEGALRSRVERGRRRPFGRDR